MASQISVRGYHVLMMDRKAVLDKRVNITVNITARIRKSPHLGTYHVIIS